MNLLSRLITKYPKIILALIVIITLFLGIMIKDLEAEADITKAIPAELPEVVYLDEINEIFPKQEFFIVGLITERLFTPETITKLDTLTKAFTNLEGVGQVLSPVNLDLINGTEEGLEVCPILEKLPETAEEVAVYRQEITTNRLYKGTFISSDETAAILLIQVEEGQFREQILTQIKQIIEENRSASEIYRIAGEGATLSEIKNIIVEDLMLLSPLVVFVILFILFISFRNIRGVVLPILAVLISAIWTLGIMALLHVPLSIMTTVVPTILIAIGSAYGIHIINRFLHILDGDKEKAIIETINHTGLAVFMAGLTTIAGFLSFISSDIDMIREFGIFTAIGVLCSLIFSLTFIAAALYLLPIPKKRKSTSAADTKNPGMLGQILAKTGEFAARKKIIILSAVIVILIFSISGIFRLRVESDLVQMFGKNTKVMQDNEFFNEYFTGTMTMQIVFDGDEPDLMKEPEVLKAMQELQKFAQTFDFVGSTQSIADMVMEMNRVMNGDSEEFYAIPDSRRLISQYLLLYSITGDESALENLVNYDYSKANMTLFVKSSNLTAMNRFEDEVNTFIEEQIHLEGIEVRTTGRITALSVLSELIVKSQLLSIIISLVLVFIITAGIFRSISLGFISTLPILLTISLNFGLMGYLDIPLDIATVLIASVAIGIGIDYSIHYISHYTYERQHGKSPAEAAAATNATTGKAIIYNAVSVGAGFLVLIFSSLASIGVLGAMIALTMFFSSAGSLTIIPAVLTLLEKRKFFTREHGKKIPASLSDME